MKILHTSDWHLGQHFMGKTRLAEHQALMDWLLEQVRIHAVDAVIIAGDIFDTGTPPSYARELYNHFVLAMQDSGAQLVVLGGNHDSVAMLAESKNLLARLGTLVIPAVAEHVEDQVHVLRRRDGTPGAVLCGIPFIRPRDVLQSQAGQSATDKQLSLQQAIQDHYQQLYALAQAKSRAFNNGEDADGDLPIIATGHLTTVGASASESVREIYVGALEAFPTNAFPPATYIALGHIHRPQKVGGLEHIRYSGSPIPLSFDEARQTKEMLLVELGFADDTTNTSTSLPDLPNNADPQTNLSAETATAMDDLFGTADLFAPVAEPALSATLSMESRGLKRVQVLPVPCFQTLLSLRGSLAELERAISHAAEQGTVEKPVWLELVVSGDDYLSDLQSRVRSLTESLPVEVLRIRRERGNAKASMTRLEQETLDELTPLEVFQQRLHQETLDDELAQRLEARYRQVLSQLQETDA